MTFKNQNILVVGGAGYVGNEVIKYFLRKNVNVTCLDNLIYGQRFNLQHKRLKFLNLDISKKSQIKKLMNIMKACNYISRFSWRSYNKKYVSLSIKINEKAVINLIEYLNERKNVINYFLSLHALIMG